MRVVWRRWRWLCQWPHFLSLRFEIGNVDAPCGWEKAFFGFWKTSYFSAFEIFLRRFKSELYMWKIDATKIFCSYLPKKLCGDVLAFSDPSFVTLGSVHALRGEKGINSCNTFVFLLSGARFGYNAKHFHYIIISVWPLGIINFFFNCTNSIGQALYTKTF